MGRDATQFRVPPTVVTPADITQLARELESLDTYLHQARIRKDDPDAPLPKTSRGFEDLATLNKLDIRQAEDRKILNAFLQILHTKAPVIHISFGVEPSSAFTAKIIVWLRENVSPFILVRIGKQPTIGGGCVVRSVNKQFDFSFRQYLTAQRGQLAGALARVAAEAKAKEEAAAKALA